MSKQIRAGAALLMFALLPAPVSTGAGDPCTAGKTAASLDFKLASIGGKDVRLSDYKGQVILLNFWATWCAPCRKEIPWLVELQDEYRERGVVVLGVSVDESVPLIKPFVEELRVSYPVLIGKNREDVKEAFGPLLGFPTTVLVTRQGMLCTRHTGITSKAQLDREINALL
jgi:thiol-disulfide isomerase/thioredoxin